ncbi:MAG: helix-turn-helix domain-containing protein [Ketobacter sp.]|nr:helix-turn-helix domain-containing protein [Ketobacter sp.]
MTNNQARAKQHQANQTLKSMGARLSQILQQEKIYRLSESTGISTTMLYHYMNQKGYPALPKLALIAQECGVSLAYLFSAEQNDAQPLPQQSTPLRLTVVDDVMSPTIPTQAEIEYHPIKPRPKKKRLTDGLYLLTNQQGLIVRRIQWLETQQTYRVFGDNTHYPPQHLEEIAPIGKVTAIIQPIG